MKIKLNFGNGVVSLPEEAAVHFGRAQKEDIMVLFELAANRQLCDDFDAHADESALNIGISRARLDEAVAFWRGTGLVDTASGVRATSRVKASAEKGASASAAAVSEASANNEKSGERAATTEKRVVARRDELPSYTTEEMTRILESRDELKSIINEAQRIIGKIFNTADTNIIIGLVDHLALDGEYILILITHCVGLGKKSLRYIEKTAFGLSDNGIDNVAALEEYIARAQKIGSFEGQIRKMFGIGERDFTAKEREHLEKWVCVFGAEIKLIRAAYEATVNATGKATFGYAGKILERWHAEGIHTFEELERAKDREAVKTAFGNSFNTDDFFRAALDRGLDDL